MATCRKDGFCVSPRNEGEIRMVAEQLRKLFGYGDFRYLDVVRILEHKMPEAFPGFRYEIVEPSELPGREAEMNPLELCIRIREPIYAKAMEGDGHCRFTIAHEIAHFFLHRTQSLAFGQKSESNNMRIYMNSEWQADTFARHFLAPPSMTRGMVAGQIEVLFGVSQSVANIIAKTKERDCRAGLSQMTFGF